jgi:hypothetical protein
MNTTGRLAAICLAASVLAACGSQPASPHATAPSHTTTPTRISSPAAPATSAAPATATPTPSTLDASLCPSANVVESELGVSTVLSGPSVSPYQATPALPPGAPSISCYYSDSSGKKQVWVSMATSVPRSYFGAREREFAGTPLQLKSSSGPDGNVSGFYVATYKNEPVTGLIAMHGTRLIDVETEDFPWSVVTGIANLEISLFKTLPSGLK